MKKDKSKIIFIAATSEEIAPFRKKFSKLSQYDYLVVGVGIIEATRIFAERVKEFSSKELFIFVGSSGAYSKKDNILDTYIGSRVKLQIPPNSYLPKVISSEYLLYAPKNLGLKKKTIYNPIAITKNNGIKNLGVENLEAFALAHIANENNLKFSVITTITNHVGPNAHNEWKANNKKAAKLTADLCYELRVFLR